MVIVAVLVAIVIAALIAGGALMTAGSSAEFSKASDRAAQVRALAYSGVLAATAELTAQRADLLNGAAPKLTGEWELFHTDSIHAAIRLLPAPRAINASSEGAASASEPVLAASEAACLNINSADEAMIAGITSADVAAKLVGQRGRRYWTDRAEFVEFAAGSSLATSGATPGVNAADPHSGLERAASINSALPEESVAGLALLSATSFEPQTCWSGADGAGVEVPQTDVSHGLNEGATTTLTEVLGAELFAKVKTAIGSQTPARRSDLVAALRNSAIAPADWAAILDAACFDDKPFALGRIDVNRAPAEVLAVVPGLGPEAAAAIVRTRERLDEGKRRKLTWPLLEAVLTQDQFQTASDWLTTRSMVWTVRVEATISRDTPKAVLSRLVWTVVIDVSDVRPRIVSIRDQTLQDGKALARADFLARPEDLALAGVGADPIPNNPLLDAPATFEDDAQSGAFRGDGQAAAAALGIDANPAATGSSEMSSASKAVKDNRIGRWTTGG